MGPVLCYMQKAFAMMEVQKAQTPEKQCADRNA